MTIATTLITNQILDDNDEIGSADEDMTDELAAFSFENEKVDHMNELSIESIISKLKKVKILASSAFGKVYLCISENTGKSLVMKCIETENIDNNAKAKQEVKKFKQEVLLFKELNHERIVKYYGTTYTNTTISVVMEFMEGGSLYDKISNEGALDEKTASEKSYQILCGLEYLHNKNIVHRDIKNFKEKINEINKFFFIVGANILLDLYGNCKLADFGISKQIQWIY
ncbi:mitogen-activated protein kinase kinase kinase 2-like [Hydra vulgaris]|uniref:mitogen-activated protein kinase kinase kinase 2-like n=1 Tax=Hydra vulgaris TaxID=6087 RepID=UPI0032EA3F88